MIRELFERTQSPMLLADDYRVYVDANTAACDLLGLARSEIIGSQIEDLSPPNIRDSVPSIYAAFIEAGQQSGPFTLVRGDGTEVACSYSATANIMPGVHLSILIPTDKTVPELDVYEDDQRVPPSDNPAKITSLTSREKEVLTLLALGESNATIARQLHLAPETVRSHTRSARFKLGAKSRSHAIALAVASGQLELDAA